MSARVPHARSKLLVLLVLALLAFVLVACGPEASRVDGDGKQSGADVGNWGDPMELHGDEGLDQRIFYKTPDELPAE
jgi:hypothetical protein